MSSNPADVPPADPTNCDRERIHVPGAIQPHGCLIACTMPTWTVEAASINVDAYLGVSPDSLIGRPLEEVLPHKVVHDLRNVLQSAMVSGGSERLLDVQAGSSDTRFDLSLSASGFQSIIELVPRAGADTTASDAVILVKSMIGRLKRAATFERFLTTAAAQVRAVTGYDRVMIYQFRPDSSGEVVAESLRFGMPPYLGLRYPASDIPAQARALYKRQWLRMIPDVLYEPVPLLTAPTSTAEIDLSLASLRSASPVHREYMRNMGTRASLTISLMEDDKLWGLIACHHESPRRISSATCAAAELFGQIFSMQIEARVQSRDLMNAARARDAHDRLLATMPPEETLFDNLPRYEGALRDLLPCDGIGIYSERGFSGAGIVPPPEAIPAMIAALDRVKGLETFATDSLRTIMPEAAGFAEQVAGLLAIPFSRERRHYLLFFRREVVQTVSWGGDPNKPVEPGEPGGRLHPRKSFEAWKEIVSGTSLPWLAAELHIAEALRISLLEIVLRQADIVAQERRVAAESQSFLIAELNHRVKNILALIRSLVRQTRAGASSLDVFAEDLEQRVQALALAHDQLTATGWKHAPLRRLLEAEGQAWAHAPDRISLVGPSVLLDSRAFQALALVFHELMTNAAKYGALSRSSGQLSVTWTFDRDRNVRIEWRELGGPAVEPPRRRGFGSVIVQQTIPFELGGEAALEYRQEGVFGTFVIPASRVLEGTEEEEVKQPRGGDQDLSFKRLLLVEDSMMIALDAQAMLGEAGLEVEVAGTVADAGRSLDVNPFDAAVLDINLSGETSFGLADKLIALRMPFVFATGYGESIMIPERFRTVPIVSKPYDKMALRTALGTAEDAVVEIAVAGERDGSPARDAVSAAP